MQVATLCTLYSVSEHCGIRVSESVTSTLLTPGFLGKVLWLYSCQALFHFPYDLSLPIAIVSLGKIFSLLFCIYWFRKFILAMKL